MGWVIFAVAAITYCLTVEPTASFWDCPEFISTGLKLEVGHPPGAPIFMLTSNLFAQFAKDPQHVALMVNIMSALLSALCILFLFWTITYLAKKLIVGNSAVTEPDRWKTLLIMGAGVAGSLAYTWSDTFWFSAVEGEVYAYSSFCTALTFYLILRWEEEADAPHSDRWLILIAYLIGVSVGVHLLNLLCITAIVLVYYFKRYQNITAWGVVGWIAISGVLIALVLYGMVPGIVKVAGWFELLFVNGLGMGFNSGVAVYLLILIAALVWAVYESYRAERTNLMYASFIAIVALTGIPFYGHSAGGVIFGIILLGVLSWYFFGKNINEKFRPSARVLNTLALCITMITIGYSSYAVIVIRSSANLPMDENSPNNVFTLNTYLAREQYGSRPLFYGQAYTSQYAVEKGRNGYQYKTKKTGIIWARQEPKNENEKPRYVHVDDNFEPVFQQNMLFPRMYSQSHAREYERWGKVKGRKVDSFDPESGQTRSITMPTMIENLRFFFSYQVNFMYWRYFMWNFAGRQNDVQNSYGELDNGNWLTGFKFLDNARLGNQRFYPEFMKHKAYNVFYCMPLILGLLGLVWQWRKGAEGKKQAGIVFCLFFMTGLAIVVYLNQTPLQPRERDYAYAGSFYAYAIWIGLGVPAIAQIADKLLKNRNSKISTIVAVLIGLVVPLQMVSQTWDDHDRSGRYTCVDFGKNYLKTLPEGNNPIIFTNGDNDTFPLWYCHETEEFRTDTRACNLSYLMTDWYIDQMKRPAYKSPAIPIDYDHETYWGTNMDRAYIVPQYEKDLLKAAKNDKAKVEKTLELSNVLHYWIKEQGFIPSDTIYFTLDKDAILRSGMYIPEEYRGSTDEETKSLMPDKMVISLAGRDRIYRNDIMVFDMLLNCNWERPLYMATSIGSSGFIGLEPFFILEGMAFRISPFNFNNLGYESTCIDDEKMYNNLMSFDLGHLKEGVYLDETVRRMCQSHRSVYMQLVSDLIGKNKRKEALDILTKIDTELPASILPYSYDDGGTFFAQAFEILGNTDKSNEILLQIAQNITDMLVWYDHLSKSQQNKSKYDVQKELFVLARQIFPLFNLDNAPEVESQVDGFWTVFLDCCKNYYPKLYNSLGLNS